MLDAIPVPLQAILWPLAGAAITMTAGRLLPSWLRRLVALAAVLASLAALWSLRNGPIEPVELFWEPLGFFRMSPTLQPDGLSLWLGLTLTGALAAPVLGIRGLHPQRTSWHGLLLVALAGSLIVTMAANLPTLILGSALVDLALIATCVTTWHTTERVVRPPLDVAVMGVLSTLLLFFATLQMSIQRGTTSLLAQDLPVGVLVAVGVAGILRLMLFPLHSRRLNTPENVITVILSISTGIAILARTQSIAPILVEQRWMATVGGVAVLAGSLLAWAGSTYPTCLSSSPQDEELSEGGQRARLNLDRAGLQTFWAGLTTHQAGLTLAFVLFLDGLVPWTWIGLALTLSNLAIWWDNCLTTATTWPPWFQWLAQQVKPWWDRARTYVGERVPGLARRRRSLLARRGSALLPTVALISLLGMPFTAGVHGRWPLYATLLDRGEAMLLIAVLAADTFLAAGLWTALRIIWTQAEAHRIRPTPFLAMAALAGSTIALGVAPGSLVDDLGLVGSRAVNVSAWGLGLIFVLPWLLGAWLARFGMQIQSHLQSVGDVMHLDWLARGAAWTGQRLVGAVHWLGQVGEGAGWWGWALIVLALGAILLTAR
jgi:hypothetical protein